MPDENFASDEHELIQEITAPIPRAEVDGEQLEDVEFPIVLRGYDRLAVDAYVKQTRLQVADLRATSSPEAAVRRALERVGEEVAGILQRAHDTAEKITAHSRSEAEDRVEEARREATAIRAEAQRELEAAQRDAVDIRARAESQLADLDTETDRIWAERHRIVEDARDLATQLVALADSASERFPPADDTETGETAVEPEPPPEGDAPAEAEGPDDAEATAILPPLHQQAEAGKQDDHSPPSS